MDNEEIVVLKEIFYNKLYNKLYADGKIKDNSIILSLFQTTPNAVLDDIVDSSINYNEVERTILNSLSEQRFITGSNKPNQFVISPYGIWEIERQLETINIALVLERLDTKFFSFSTEKPLKHKEKVVLLTLIAIRAFYEKSPLNRKNSHTSQEKINEILLKSKQFLLDMKVVTDFKLMSPSEDPVESVFRRLDELKTKTGNLYQFADRKHWLSIYDEDKKEISHENLSYLLWKIFGSDLSYEQQKTVVEFCDEILRKYKNYVFNDDEFTNHIFSRADFGDTINKALFSIPVFKDTWGNV
ncbi:hypothetical protein [uncultured Methanomethylovorans sp.]|uniref:hypothetical protein n=1 Tax=uncultured Methanomethylovorans sp. TaxID=183759 RepID=UPI002AA74C7C|nr:hypothetical protein [uncultured Methanomethylovorans sp.]